MTPVYNIYCDESCHLEHDHQKVMVLGAVWCTVEKAHEASRRVKEIKFKYGLQPDHEAKWTKVSPAKVRFYLDLVDYFFDDDDLFFRALVVPDKGALNHAAFHQDHDTWYYKMYFDMLKVILSPTGKYQIYLDIKDTCSAQKTDKLHDVLCNNLYDFQRSVIARVQTVRSHEVQLLQLSDVLIGAVMAANRGIPAPGMAMSDAKVAIIRRVQARSGYRLNRTTLLRESKLNLFVWSPSVGDVDG